MSQPRRSARRSRLSVTVLTVIALAAQLVPVSGVSAQGDDQAALMSRIPAEIAATCAPGPLDSGVYPGETARAVCNAPGVSIAIYQQFDSVANMDNAFERDLGFATDSTGEDCQVGPSQHGYTIGGTHAGRVMCYDLFGKAAIEWTDERLRVLSTGIGVSADFATTYDWWLGAGPNPGPQDQGGGTVGGSSPVPVGPAVSTAGPIASGGGGGVGRPPSEGKAIIYHLQFATDIDASSGLPVGLGDAFPVGVPTIVAMLGWGRVQPGTELGIRLYSDDRFLGEAKRTVLNPSNAGFAVPFQASGGFPAGDYKAEVTYNGVPDEVATFQVLDATAGTPGLPPTTPGTGTGIGTPGAGIGTLGAGPDLGQVPYPDPASVLIVTRSSVLRAKLGASYDQVIAAANTVGSVQDLDGTLGTGTADWNASVGAVRTLLGGGQFRYLLILGNDDAVPYARLPNPLAAEEHEDLDPWQLSADEIASDDPYGDLDGDQLGVPDIGVARIPSSEDAQILLTQLGTVVTPPTGGFALINAQRRSQAGVVAGLISNQVSVDAHFVPPTRPDQLGSTTEGKTRYLYVLLHGIGVTTDEWAGDVQAWRPLDTTDPFGGEWQVSVGAQVPGMTIPFAASAGSVVNVGACYGAWTIDTIQEPQHKDATNNLALSFLRSGTRAFIADTHLSYTTGSTAAGPLIGRTGFEIALWQGILGGATPIDAYLAAKKNLGQVTLQLIAAAQAGQSVGDAINLNMKTIHHMVYLGRP